MTSYIFKPIEYIMIGLTKTYQLTFSPVTKSRLGLYKDFCLTTSEVLQHALSFFFFHTAYYKTCFQLGGQGALEKLFFSTVWRN